MNRLTVLLLCSALAACGFQPKGRPTALPARTWQLQGGSLHNELTEALRRNGAATAAQAAQSLNVTAETQRKDIYTITRAAKLNEYLLTLHLTAQAHRHGQAWGAPMRVEIRRSLPYADAMILGKQEEEARIWQEMRQDAADQIVRRLAFLPSE